MDLETYTNEKGEIYIYCICLLLNNKWYYFWYDEKIDIIVNFLEKIGENSKTEDTVLYTHNINFDGFVFINFLKKTFIKFDWFSRGLNLYWIDIYYLKKKIRIRCSYKIIPISIKKLGEIIKVEKKIFPYKFISIQNLNYKGEIPNVKFFNSIEDYVEFKKKNVEFDFKKISLDYCKQDTLIIKNVLDQIIKIISSYDKKVITNSFSFSSISYKIYIKKYDVYEIKKNYLKNEEYSYFKSGYYGGRCEVFGNPVENEIVHHFDFTGMYAQCMLQKFPTGLPYLKEKNLNLKETGFHAIKFKCDSYLPYLPIRNNKLLFANGTMSGIYWYEEILNAINFKKCEILEHYSSYVYNYEDYIFKDYVNDFINIRKKGLYYNIFGKNMVNGLYGSFALSEDNFFTTIVYSEEELNSILQLVDVNKWRNIGNVFIVEILKNKKSSIFFDKKDRWNDKNKRNVGYAAIIASKARIKLNNALETVLNNKGRLYYTDTDSIFAGFKENNLNKVLGEITWSDVYEDAVFISSKFYQIKNKKIKLKGIKIEDYSFEKLKKEFYGNNQNTNFENQLNIYKKDFTIFLNYNLKSVKMDSYDKRTFLENKKETKPILINTDYIY